MGDQFDKDGRRYHVVDCGQSVSIEEQFNIDYRRYEFALTVKPKSVYLVTYLSEIAVEQGLEEPFNDIEVQMIVSYRPGGFK